MHVQTSLPDENASLPFQVETDPAALSKDDASRRSTRCWTGLGFGVLMLIGASACALHPLASHISSEPSRLVPEVAFNHIAGIRPATQPGSGHARPTAFRPDVLAGVK